MQNLYYGLMTLVGDLLVDLLLCSCAMNDIYIYASIFFSEKVFFDHKAWVVYIRIVLKKSTLHIVQGFTLHHPLSKN